MLTRPVIAVVDDEPQALTALLGALARRVGKGASICGEGFLPGSTFTVSPDVSQGRNDIE